MHHGGARSQAVGVALGKLDVGDLSILRDLAAYEILGARLAVALQRRNQARGSKVGQRQRDGVRVGKTLFGHIDYRPAAGNVAVGDLHRRADYVNSVDNLVSVRRGYGRGFGRR